VESLVRLSKNGERKSDRSPTHYLWKMEPIPKEKRGGPTAAAEPTVEEAEFEEGEGELAQEEAQ
jgi:hypothetical protein